MRALLNSHPPATPLFPRPSSRKSSTFRPSSAAYNQGNHSSEGRTALISCVYRETEKTSIRFYGHPGIEATVKAICQVENGPVYELNLHGQASYMAYRLDTHELNFGDVHFDKSATRTLTLTNAGLVPLDYRFLDLHNLNPHEQRAHLKIEPESGICDPLSSVIVTIKLTPNIPEAFDKVLFLQVAHYQPDEIQLTGTGMFCRLEMDLPRYLIGNSVEEKLLEQIPDRTHMGERALQTRLDTLIVQNFVDKAQPSSEPVDPAEQQPSLRSSQASLATSITTAVTKRSPPAVKFTPILPDYVVDFDHVILGTVRQQIVHVRNPTSGNITFQLDRASYKNTGFSFDCDRVKNLPPAESIPITITFDPRGANLGLGSVEYRVPVEVSILDRHSVKCVRLFVGHIRSDVSSPPESHCVHARPERLQRDARFRIGQMRRVQNRHDSTEELPRDSMRMDGQLSRRESPAGRSCLHTPGYSRLGGESRQTGRSISTPWKHQCQSPQTSRTYLRSPTTDWPSPTRPENEHSDQIHPCRRGKCPFLLTLDEPPMHSRPRTNHACYYASTRAASE